LAHRHAFCTKVSGEAVWLAVLSSQRNKTKEEEGAPLSFENEQKGRGWRPFNVLQKMLIRLSHTVKCLSTAVFGTKIWFNLPSSGVIPEMDRNNLLFG